MEEADLTVVESSGPGSTGRWRSCQAPLGFALGDASKCPLLLAVAGDLLDECKINMMGLYLEKSLFLCI